MMKNQQSEHAHLISQNDNDHIIEIPVVLATPNDFHHKSEKLEKLCKTLGVTIAAGALQTLNHCAGVLAVNAVSPVFRPHLFLEVISLGNLEVCGLIAFLANVGTIPERRPNLSNLFSNVFGFSLLASGMLATIAGELSLHSIIRETYLEADEFNLMPFKHASDVWESERLDAEQFYPNLVMFGFGTACIIPLTIFIALGVVCLTGACAIALKQVTCSVKDHVKNSVTYLWNSPTSSRTMSQPLLAASAPELVPIAHEYRSFRVR